MKVLPRVVAACTPLHPFRAVAAVCLALTAFASSSARAADYHYVDWMVAAVAQGTASGLITLPDGSSVQVGFAALKADGTPGNLYGAQTQGSGANYWSPATPYRSDEVANAPPGTDLLQLAGGQNQTYKVTLSEPIKDPIMAIVSLGAPGATITYDFDSPFTIVSQGPGYWGGTNTSLVALPDDVLQGTEGHGTIRFVGTFASFSWTVPRTETWHGFTFGIRTTERIEPTPDAGAADAGTPDGSVDGEVALPDTGVVDTGLEAPDAGAIDAAVPDAAPPAFGASLEGAATEPEPEAGPAEETPAEPEPEEPEQADEPEDEEEPQQTESDTSRVQTGIDASPNGCGCSTATWPQSDTLWPLAIYAFAFWRRKRARSSWLNSRCDADRSRTPRRGSEGGA